jgi:benzoyl-CoA-dihydrodiol lyase
MDVAVAVSRALQPSGLIKMQQSQKDREERVVVVFDRTPEAYRHWRLDVQGRTATLKLQVAEDGGIRPGYRLKLNSYDLGVDIELHDALQRIRFEHPEVAVVVIASAQDRTFCSGANIFMLAQSEHAWKVNFCKFTNETRNGMEDSSRYSGIKFIAAVNGACAGGGYEVALACDEILMVDDRSSAVSLPEVPLLGVLPGTGGLTRVVDKRKVRRDIADLFCTSADGVRADRAKAWNLVDHIAKPSDFQALVAARAAALAHASQRPAQAAGIELKPLAREIDDQGYRYEHVQVSFDRASRTATLLVSGPADGGPKDMAAIEKLGCDWWPIAFARQLDDALLMLRQNELELGTVILRTQGSVPAMLSLDRILWSHRGHWLGRETIGLLRRTLARLDVTSRSLIAVIDVGSVFAGTLLELALAADRSYMLAPPAGAANQPMIALSELNFGAPDSGGLEMPNDLGRLSTRFWQDEAKLASLRARLGRPLAADAALEMGLVTLAPDEIDWDDEIRLMIEERSSLSPDALTAMEASLRFPGPETLATRIFGRLTAWQNWVFNRGNATGPRGALKVFGTGDRAEFDWERV